jgi:hypothetical protein
MHPLIDSLENLKDSELDAKINDLTKKYFMTTNFEVQRQIAVVLDTHKEELSKRRAKEWLKMSEKFNKNLDNLIKVN